MLRYCYGAMSTPSKSKDTKSNQSSDTISQRRLDGTQDGQARTPSVVRTTPEGERKKAERKHNEDATRRHPGTVEKIEHSDKHTSAPHMSDGEPHTERRRVTREGTDTHAGPVKKKTDVKETLAGTTWVALSIGVALLILLLIFIIQNMEPVTLTVFFWKVSFPAGVGFLLAAVIGAVIVLSVGSVRMLQLRRHIRDHEN